MIKYICVNKESKRVYTFVSFLDKLSNKYKIADLDKGEITCDFYESEEEIIKFLEKDYEIKIREVK